MRNLPCKSLITSLIMTYSLLVSQGVSACDIHGKSGIVPENNLKIPVGLKGLAGGITEVTFNKVIDRVGALYTKEVKAKGAILKFERNWTDGTVNAYAHRDDKTKTWFISMFGGLARHPQMTEDGFAVVVCHELGHHIGGAPKKIDAKAGSIWASNEGQADYFATLKCLRNYFAKDDNALVVSKLKVPELVTRTCQNQFANNAEVALCQRSSMAGLVLGNFFKVLMNTAKEVSFSTPDKAVVKTTFDSHPEAQCRLDTYFSGAACDKSIGEKVSDKDENLGTCTKRNGDQLGTRPLCWFKAAI